MSEVYLYRYWDLRTKKAVDVNRLFPSHRVMRREYPHVFNGVSDMAYFDGNGQITRSFLSCTRYMGLYYYGAEMDFEEVVLRHFGRLRSSVSCFRIAPL